MAYGITCTNTSGQLTLDSEGFLLGYLGKATFVSLTHASGDSIFSQAGYATYGFTSPGTGSIVCALGLRASGSSGARIESVTRTGSNTWSIRVIDTGTVTEGYNNLYWTNLTNATIYVWGVPSSVSGYGAALYNSAGVLTADLTKRPMIFTERVSFADNVMSTTMGSYVKPAIVGHTNSFHNLATDTGVGGTPWFNTQYKGVWEWDGSTTLTRGDILNTADHDDGPGLTTLGHAATSVLIIEANGLP
jgi:hypothetical protein